MFGGKSLENSESSVEKVWRIQRVRWIKFGEFEVHWRSVDHLFSFSFGGSRHASA